MPKSELEMTECEDAIGINLNRNRFAVADGATEAFAAQSWARQLAENWVNSDLAIVTVDEFRTWAAAQGQVLHESWNTAQLSWYAEEKARSGSFAALAGVQVDLSGDIPCWNAIALGDTCLVHLRNGEIVQALPISSSDSFNATPWLLPSHIVLLDAACERIAVASGAVEHGDFLLLLSDAVAAWLLKLFETGDAPAYLDRLLRFPLDQDFADFVVYERTSGRLRDDDIAVISIEVLNRGIS